MRRLLFPGLICLVASIAASQAAVEWDKKFIPDDNTLFLAHFDNIGDQADFARGNPQIEKCGKIMQTDGKFGRALTGFDDPQNCLKIATEGNVDFNCGLIEMWIRPDFDHDKAPEQYCFLFCCDAADKPQDVYKNSMYAFYDKREQVFTFCWRADQKAAFAFSHPQRFKRGEWLHIACIFGGEANIIAIMVNGKMSTVGELPGRWQSPPKELIVGRGKTFGNAKSGARLAHVAIDELRIKNSCAEYKSYNTEKIFEFDGKKYFYAPRNTEPDPPRPQVSFFRRLFSPEYRTGFLVFQRDPRLVYPDSIPQKEEITGAIKLAAAPGERKAFYFSLHALRDLPDLKIRAAPPAEESGQALELTREIRVKKAAFWPQMPIWATRSYYIIPELLERFDDVLLRQNESCTFWVDFRTSPAAKAGKYKGLLAIETQAGDKLADIPFEVAILPFKLEEPDDKHWLMYIDPYPDKKIDQQKEMLELFKDYGISGLILNFTSSKTFSLAAPHGKITEFQSDYLNDILKIYNQAGLKGPVAFWFQFNLEQSVAKALGVKDAVFSDPWKSQVEAGLRQAVPLIDAFIKERAPGLKWCFYGRDEPPPDSDTYRRTLWVYKIMRSLGVNTCLTYYLMYKDEREAMEFLPFLNADISAGPTVKNLKMLAAAGTKFWYLGGGCYTGQEGGLMPNRFHSGFGFAQTEGEAHVSWVWQRVKGDAFNEFKQNNYRERKSSMIAYPARNADAPESYISTLQWEGIREGITDYKYLYTLRHYIALARKNGLREAADAAENKLNAILSRIPEVFRDSENAFKIGNYYLDPGNFTDTAANECREEIALEITGLVRLLNK
ncbi:MAG: hypothetical protein PHP98_06900 [Kiritimatiellae bacterium]|nr:hypothetical protein [Kiritimatiellia bacterium]